MKKRFLISVMAIACLTVLLAMPVFAASATANVNSVTANRGDTVTMTVTLAKGVTVGSGAVEISYDSAVLELVKGEWNVSNTMLATFTGNKGAFAYMSGTQISGKVFTATFKVKSNAAFGASAVKMTLQLKDGANAEISVTNNSGKVTVECKHSYSSWKSANGSSHTRTCSVCKAQETGSHAYSNACDTSCNSCGYTRTITHSYKTTWSTDSSKHWHECSVCKIKKDEAAHIPGPAATETTPQTCTTCGYVIQKALGHTHKPVDEWLSDANNHWRACYTCDKRVEETSHIYDNECDTSCNVCGYIRSVTHMYASEWTSNKNEHWHTCSICGGKDRVLRHEPGPEATEESPQLCIVCDYELNPVKPHEHKYVGDYITDAGDHWMVCKCGEISAKEAHTYADGVVVKEPTKEEIGEKQYTCTVCAYVKKAELELVEKEVSDPTEEKPSTTTPSTEKEPTASTTEESSFSVVTFVIGMVVGVIVTAGVALVVKKKNSPLFF